MIDKPTLKKWTEQARRDDWHVTFVGSDIRQMLGEIERRGALLERWLAYTDPPSTIDPNNLVATDTVSLLGLQKIPKARASCAIQTLFALRQPTARSAKMA